jgi:hypothetical protein
MYEYSYPTLNELYKQTGENDLSLCIKFGVPQLTVWRCRTGRAIPMYQTAVKISDAMGGAISAESIQKQAAEMRLTSPKQDGCVKFTYKIYRRRGSG